MMGWSRGVAANNRMQVLGKSLADQGVAASFPLETAQTTAAKMPLYAWPFYSEKGHDLMPLKGGIG